MTIPDTQNYMLILILILCSTLSVAAKADDIYYGAKIGYFDKHKLGGEEPSTLGVVVGYERPVESGNLAVEAELSSTFDDGKSEERDVDVNTAALYGAYTTSLKYSELYFKVKAGALYYDLNLAGGDDDNRLSPAGGVGLGLNMNKLRFEFELVKLDGSKMITFLVRF